jgi:hypothetical protein
MEKLVCLLCLCGCTRPLVRDLSSMDLATDPSLPDLAQKMEQPDLAEPALTPDLLQAALPDLGTQADLANVPQALPDLATPPDLRTLPDLTTLPDLAPCVPESDEQMCRHYGEACVGITAADNCGNMRQATCRWGCTSEGCVIGGGTVLPDGTSCAKDSIGGDWMNSCWSGVCVPALAFCQESQSLWGFQEPGTGGWGAQDCSCLSPTFLRWSLIFSDGTPDIIDKTCQSCISLTGRRVCF